MNDRSALSVSARQKAQHRATDSGSVKDQRSSELLSERPCLSEDCLVTPIVIRQEHWVIINNPLAGTHVRLHRALWHAVKQLDGTVTVRQWIDVHSQQLSEQALLTAVLHLQRADMLSAASSSTSVESLFSRLFRRHNPLMLRVPLFNPTRLLDAICSATARVSARAVITVLVVLVLCALFTLAMHWSSVLAYWQQSVVDVQVLHYLLVYPIVKTLHELAHGLTLRRLGGQVPEAGVSFLVLFPMPYVDAGDAWSLARGNRMLVSAAGMLMDLLLASIGFLLWVNLSSGLIGDLAFITALVGLVSVFVFNANPLLKFDGYYLLEDALDSPGLARRSVMYYQYLFKRHVLMLSNAVPPALAQGEKGWLLVYGAASTLYRFVIAAIICVFLISTLHELGVVLSLFSLIPLLALPLIRWVRFLCVSPELACCRARAISITSLLLVLLAGTLFTVPMPSSSRTQGIVWVDEQAQIYAATGGQVSQILVDNGETVEQGQPLMVIESPQLVLELAQKRSAVRQGTLEVARYRQSNPALARSAMTDLEQLQTEVDDVLARLDALTISAPLAGRVAMDSADLTTGSYVEKGELLGYVVDNSARVIRTVIDQNDLGRVEQGVSGARVRLAQNMMRSLPARLSRQVPSGSHELPSAALANTGFGGFHVQVPSNAPGNDQSVKTRDKVFHLELIVTGQLHALQQVPIGTRAFVTLVHDNEPLGARWLRLARGLLLRHLG